MRYWLAVILTVAATACTSIQYDLPPVSQDVDGEHRQGKFIWHDLVSDDVEGSQAFYAELFGWEFRQVPLTNASYWLISLNGKPIGGMVAQRQVTKRAEVSQWVSLMSVADVSATNARAVEMGATALTPPVSLGSRGTVAVYQDPGGAVFATLQTPDGDAPDTGLPEEGDFLWHELWSPDVDAATDFYTSLSGLEAGSVSEGPGADDDADLRILRGDGLPRSGIRDLPADDMPSIWMPYLRIETVDNLNGFLARVPELGGEVLVPALPRSLGGYVAVIADPSGAPIALQTWSDEQTLEEGQ